MTLYEYIINHSYPLLIDNNDLSEIESQFNVKLSDSLREFFITYNGTQIPVCIVEDDDSLEVSSFIPVKHGTLPVEKIMRWNYDDGIIPKGFIPFASDRGGNIYYCDTENNDCILFIDHEEIENPEIIGSSISSFLQHLQISNE